MMMFLSKCQIRWACLFFQRMGIKKHQQSFALFQRIVGLIRIAKYHKFRRQLSHGREYIFIAFCCICRPLWQINLHGICQSAHSRIHYRPVILPLHSGKESLTPHGGIPFQRSDRQHDHIPLVIYRLHQISMAHITDWIFPAQVSMCQDWITEVIFIWSVYILTAAYSNCVIRAGASLCMHDIIVFPDFIQMRSLRPDNISHGTVPYIMHFSYQLHVLNIQLLNPDIPVTIILASRRIGVCSNIIAGSILIKEQAGVYSIRSLNVMRLRPRSCWILGCNNEITTVRYIGAYDIKCSFMITDCRCEQASGMSCIPQW